jgi:proteasome lid subunit RPN8/RPN11
MVTGLHLRLEQYQEMIAHLRGAYPEEACGLMAGLQGEVLRLYPVENHLHSPVTYEMEPLQQLRALEDLEDVGWELLAIYHSHPHGPEIPSATDIAQAYYPDALNVIVSLANVAQPVVRVFSIRDGAVGEEDLAVT